MDELEHLKVSQLPTYAEAPSRVSRPLGSRQQLALSFGDYMLQGVDFTVSLFHHHLCSQNDPLLKELLVNHATLFFLNQRAKQIRVVVYKLRMIGSPHNRDSEL